ncbi:MAG: NAD(P)H-binding protein [Tateyamaria sp.]
MTGAPPKRVAVFGATGTAGQAARRVLIAAGHDVTCIGRSDAGIDANVTQPLDIEHRFDVVVSCLASRSGSPADAWAIDHGAQLNILNWAQGAGVQHFILLSAICVQKPKLPFQHAKLAFEAALIQSGLTYSIVRPTAFFKSLSGQLGRVRDGKPFLVFGDGTLTACKPISDDDLGRFITGCIDDPLRHNQVLPIGGPGPAITPLDQVAALSDLLGQQIKIKRVPAAMIAAIYRVLWVVGWVSKRAADKAELARIGHYYATESMLVWDGARYDADATPETGTETLRDHYAAVTANNATVQRSDHTVF